LIQVLKDKTLRDYIFFISEITTLVLIYIFTTYSLWMFFPKEAILIKGILTLIIVANFYNISKHFIYVRIILWKAQEKQPQKDKYEGMEKVK